MRVFIYSHINISMEVTFNNFNYEFNIQKTKEEKKELLKNVINCIEKICIHKKINFKLLIIEENNCAYFNYNGYTCFINDNGGEFNFDKCNLSNYLNVPYDLNNESIESIELALRILQGLEGQVINYNKLSENQIKAFNKIYQI